MSTCARVATRTRKPHTCRALVSRRNFTSSILPRLCTDTSTRAMAGASRRALARALAEASRRVSCANAPVCRHVGAARSRREAPLHVWSSATSRPPTRVRSAFAAPTGLAASRSWSSEAKDDLPARVEDLESADATRVNPRKDLYMMFTCGVCETRAAKGFSRQAYENGVVIVRCPGCQSQHLVADHHGWFGDKGTIEDFLRERGEGVARGKADLPGSESEDGTLEIDPEQLRAWMEKSGIAER